MIFISNIEIIVIGLSFSLGMLGVFLAAKKGGKANHNFKLYSMSESIWFGYLVGNKYCILSFVLLAGMALIIAQVSVLEALGIMLYMTFIVAILSFILGLILYLPCALFGYNLYARKLAELEIARTQQQILNESIDREVKNEV